MAAGKRNPGESYESYKARLKREEKIVSAGIAVGKILWPAQKGTYLKPKVTFTKW